MTKDIAENAVMHVVGARPNFPKLAPVYRALEHDGVPQLVVHSGQHFDNAMSAGLISALGIPEPDVNLHVGSGSHADQTATVLSRVAEVMAEARPRLVMVYGDINTTVAATLAATKLGIPVAHVESGLRSYDRTMPEEINRLVTDSIADFHFATSPDAVENLRDEGHSGDNIYFVGNPMIDSLYSILPSARAEVSARLAELDLRRGEYAVVTLHRPSNVDDAANLEYLCSLVQEAACRLPILFAAHPRILPRLHGSDIASSANVRLVSAMEYPQFIATVDSAALVITDSGGIQEETTALGIPCLTLRKNTERPITVTEGTNRLLDPEDLLQTVDQILKSGEFLDHKAVVPELWDGHAGERIAAVVSKLVT